MSYRLTAKGVDFLLCLALTQGEYVTIGEHVVIQVDRMTNDRCKLLIQAPREVPVLRGELRERAGGDRPDCVVEEARWRKAEIPWNRSKAQALAAMRKTLSRMDGTDEDVKALRRQLNHMFPETERPNEVSSG